MTDQFRDPEAPCPFCGCTEAEPVQDPETDDWRVECAECNSTGPLSDTRLSSIRAWDERSLS